ncbi:Ribosome maturation factor RimP OS=Cellulomonas persica OX=76861 GN=CPE01_13700 PE=4 SV=1 [Cellulomonas persica]|uniref:Uncharacterized protein n=2 Tax=Cellulomonas persica TaxID=76861 RepID=A0A510USJ6_9CELL|nr:hypothetical protein CPE01_13700 [Cellulomonas persica]
MVGRTLGVMVTISCSCGAAANSRTHPLRGVPIEERMDLVRTAYSAYDGFLTLEVDASWHPGSSEPEADCVVLVDMDALDACEGLSDEERHGLSALLGIAHVRGRVLPPPVEIGSVRFRVSPAFGFDGEVVYVVHDGPQTLLEVTCPYGGRGELAALVELYSEHGPAAVVQVDGLAPRLGLSAAIAGIARARTPSVA